tara:strand:+ start:305 stop:1072 length:768 start_codon:yes stop_codon:yes gene_type:complete
MDKNKLIKDRLDFYIKSSLKLFKQHPFPKLIQEEINQFNDIIWIESQQIEIDAYKQEKKSELNNLLNDKQLHEGLETLFNDLTKIHTKEIQDNVELQLIENLTKISFDLTEEKKDFKLNLLFLEHDYEPEACFCGFDDEDYTFKLLSGEEYLKYNYNKELFNGAGRFDYSALIYPILKFEEEIGEDKAFEIDQLFSAGGYLEDVKKLYLINAYLGIHNCLDKIKGEFRNIRIPMRDNVHVFGNEHDCEQLNIYVI